MHEFEAVYENGVLRPLTALPLAESQRVRLTVDDTNGRMRLDPNVLNQARDEASRLSHVPTIQEVRSALSVIPGNMSDVVLEERGDY